MIGTLLLFSATQTGWRIPVEIVGVLAILAAAHRSGLIRADLPHLKWQVPQAWARFGHLPYAALFGLVLGIGLLTPVASAGFYVLLAWALTAPSWQTVLSLFAVLGLARAFPLLLVALKVQGTREYPLAPLRAVNQAAADAIPLEVALLVLSGVLFLIN